MNPSAASAFVRRHGRLAWARPRIGTKQGTERGGLGRLGAARKEVPFTLRGKEVRPDEEAPLDLSTAEQGDAEVPNRDARPGLPPTAAMIVDECDNVGNHRGVGN